MKVILSENVPNLGEMGETVKVADGYARNFLIPRKMAVAAESASAQQIEHEMRIIKQREEKVRAELAKVAKEIESLTIEIKARAGLEDKIFGSVTAVNIADELKSRGYEVDRKTVLLDEPIKALGIYSVPVRLITGIEPEVKVWVTSEEPAEEAVAEEATPAQEPVSEQPEAAAGGPAAAEEKEPS